MPASTASALVALHVAVLLFGFAGLFGKWLDLPPTAIVLGRTLVAAAALAAIVVARRQAAPPTRGLAVNGFVLAVHWTAFFAAIQVSSVAIGLLGCAAFPLFVLLLERVLLGRRWQAIEAATAVLVTAGLVILVPWVNAGDGTPRGLLLGLAAGFTFAMLAVRNRAFAQTHSPLAVGLWQNAFAALALAPVVVLSGALPGTPSARDIVLVLVLGLACTALAHTLFIASLRRLSAHTASVVAALEPLYGIALAVMLLAEIPTLRTLAGGGLIVAAALVATRRAA